MTAIANLLRRKQRLLDLLGQEPGPNERDEIKRQIAQIDAALTLLEETGPNTRRNDE
jgi:hypothetical protein